MSNLKLEVLSSTYRKQEQPACLRCHYDAEYILGIGQFTRTLCERCLTDVLMDALSYAEGKI